MFGVLLIRKRTRRSLRGQCDQSKTVVKAETDHVTISARDRVAFDEFVGMYFPGCESFVMDVV